MPIDLNATAAAAQANRLLHPAYKIYVNSVEMPQTLVLGYTWTAERDSQMKATITLLNSGAAFSVVGNRNNFHNGDGTVDLVAGGIYVYEPASGTLHINNAVSSDAAYDEYGATIICPADFISATISSPSASDVVRPIRKGDTIKIVEILEGQSFDKFYGRVDKVSVDASGRTHTVRWECLDLLTYAGDLDCSYNEEGASSATLSPERLVPDNSLDNDFWYGTIETYPPPVAGYYMTYTTLCGGDYISDVKVSPYIYNLTRNNWAQVEEYTPALSRIKFTSSSGPVIAGWKVGDRLTTKTTFSIFNLSQPGIDTRKFKLITRSGTGAGVEVSQRQITIKSAEGQVLVGGGLNLVAVTAYASYSWFSSGLAIEDIIEAILIQADGYGVSPISAITNLRSSYQAENGSRYDYLFPNTVELEYKGVTYGVGRVWYFSYSNITSTITQSHLGLSYAPIIDARNGAVYLHASESTPSSLHCTLNYSFKTIQATGITVPYAWFTPRSTENRMSAIRTLLKYVAPNYSLYTRGNLKIYGQFLRQNAVKDTEIYNPTQIQYYSADEVYTRVLAFAVNRNPTLATASIEHFNQLNSIEQRVDVALINYGKTADYYIFCDSERYPIVAGSTSQYTPKIKKNGILLGTDFTQTVLGVTQFWDMGNNQYKIFCEDLNPIALSGMSSDYEFLDSSLAVLPNLSIARTGTLLSNGYYIYAKGARGEVSRCRYIRVKHAAGSHGNLVDYWIDYDNGLFYISSAIVDPEIDEITASYWFASGTQDSWLDSYSGSSRSLSDGLLNTGAQCSVRNINPIGATAFCAVLEAPVTLDAIDVGAGYYTVGSEAQDNRRTFPISFNITLQYSADAIFVGFLKENISAFATSFSIFGQKNISRLQAGDTLVFPGGEEVVVGAVSILDRVVTLTGCTRGANSTTAVAHDISPFIQIFGEDFIFNTNTDWILQKTTWSDICSELTGMSMTSGDYVQTSQDAFGEGLTVGAFRVVINDCSPLEYYDDDGESKIQTYAVSLHSLKGYSDSVLRAEAKLTTGTPSASLVADTTDLLASQGDRVKKLEFGPEIPMTADELQAMATNWLRASRCGINKVNVQELFNPALEMGATVELTDEINRVNEELYFCESVTGRMTGRSVAHEVVLTKYED